MEDEYQVKYLAHQQRKKDVLVQIMKERHSNRMFSDERVEQEHIDALLDAKEFAPSSCDRQAVQITVVDDRDKKALLGGILVGGVGWIHRAPVILLLIADPVAYKAGDEITYMPYLDAGCVIQQLYLTATALNLHCAYANPNIRDMNKQHFSDTFGEGVFCGAFGFGHPYDDTRSNA